MKVIDAASQFEEVIKKSRFIACLFPCSNEEAALLHLRQLQQQHPAATHVVYAYRILTETGMVCRFNDAGEPSGTAGKPIFQHLEGKQLGNALLAVVRYFGGIKLGAGGLTRAYGNSAKAIIDQAVMRDYVEMAELQFSLDYSQLQHFNYQLEKLAGQIVRQEFADKVHLVVSLPKFHVAAMQSVLA